MSLPLDRSWANKGRLCATQMLTARIESAGFIACSGEVGGAQYCAVGQQCRATRPGRYKYAVCWVARVTAGPKMGLKSLEVTNCFYTFRTSIHEPRESGIPDG